MNRGIGHCWYVIKKLYNLSFQFLLEGPVTFIKKKQGSRQGEGTGGFFVFVINYLVFTIFGRIDV